MRRFKNSGLLLCAVAAILLQGCGGGGTASTGKTITVNGPDPKGGNMTFNLVFPPSTASKATNRTRAYNGSIPIGTKSVEVLVTDSNGNYLVAPKIITAPLDAQGDVANPVVVVYAFVPAGYVAVQALCFSISNPVPATTMPDTNPNALATSSAHGTIVPLQTTYLDLPFQLTGTSLSVTPSTLALAVRGTTRTSGTLTAAVTDVNGVPVLYPLFWISSDPTVATVSYDPANSDTATIQAVGPGEATITVLEQNSGMTAESKVTVTGPPP